MNNEPDGMLGAVMASEGLGLTATLVNGPGGCRSRAQAMLRDVIPGYRPEGCGCCRSPYYGKQSRLPCTYLDGNDLVFGTSGKLRRAYDSVREAEGRPAAVVDTLGSELLCTDRSDLPGDAVFPDTDLSEMTFDGGYDAMTECILRSSPISGGRRPMSVNILGYGIPDLGWKRGAAELSALLGAMGVEDVTAVGCMEPPDRVLRSGSADLNIALVPSRCVRTAEFYGREFGIPVLVPSAGIPAGYPATRSFLREVASELGIDPSPALDIVDRDASEVHSLIMNADKLMDQLRGRGFAVKAGSETVLPICRMMMDTFMMVPYSVEPTDGYYSGEIRGFLEERGFGVSLYERDPRTPDVVFTDGMEAAYGRSLGGRTSFVTIRMPYTDNIDLMGRCTVGNAGSRYLIDSILNGLVRFRCGQPTHADMR